MAEAWLVLTLTHNGAAVGGTFAFRFAPVLLFGLWGGVIADRFDRRRILLITQSLAGVLAIGAVAARAHRRRERLVGVRDRVRPRARHGRRPPAHNAFVEEMVGRDQMPNAVALNSAVMNSARITGPAIAALLIAQAGVAWVFFVNAVSFIAVVGSLLTMRAGRAAAGPALDRSRRGSGRASRYAWGIARDAGDDR